MDSKQVMEANTPHPGRSSIPAQGSPAGGRTPPKAEPSLLQAKHPRWASRTLNGFVDAFIRSEQATYLPPMKSLLSYRHDMPMP